MKAKIIWLWEDWIAPLICIGIAIIVMGFLTVMAGQVAQGIIKWISE